MPPWLSSLPQPLQIGIVAGLCGLGGAGLALLGVLATTRVSWRLGRRTQDQTQKIAEVTADAKRIDQLMAEKEQLRTSEAKMRGDLEGVWDKLQAGEAKHDEARQAHRRAAEAWDAEREALLAQIKAGKRENEILDAMVYFACRGQEHAEGALKEARAILAQHLPAVAQTPPTETPPRTEPPRTEPPKTEKTDRKDTGRVNESESL